MDDHVAGKPLKPSSFLFSDDAKAKVAAQRAAKRAAANDGDDEGEEDEEDEEDERPIGSAVRESPRRQGKSTGRRQRRCECRVLELQALTDHCPEPPGTLCETEEALQSSRWCAHMPPGRIGELM